MPAQRRSAFTPRLVQPTARTCAAMLLMLAAMPAPAGAQDLPFSVTIVDWDRSTLERQRRAFRSEAEQHEVLFCVESWTTTPIQTGVDRVVITGVRRERAGQKSGIRDVGDRCIGKDGERLPMFHTHSDGNCQFSPSDLITLVARAAPFEGVQCGERHFVWAFAWQVAAIAATAELAAMAAPARPQKGLTGGPGGPPVRTRQP